MLIPIRIFSSVRLAYVTASVFDLRVVSLLAAHLLTVFGLLPIPFRRSYVSSPSTIQISETRKLCNRIFITVKDLSR